MQQEHEKSSNMDGQNALKAKGPDAEPPKKKKASAKKVAAPAKKTNARGTSPHPLDATIKLLDDSNPHRKDTNDFKKWSKISALHSKTVEKALDAKIDRGYLHYMVAKGKMKID